MFPILLLFFPFKASALWVFRSTVPKWGLPPKFMSPLWQFWPVTNASSQGKIISRWTGQWEVRKALKNWSLVTALETQSTLSKYFKLEYCKANRRKVGMGCTSLPAFLSPQSYCSPSSKGKNSVYLTFLAQPLCLLSHLCLSQQFSPCSFPKVKIPHELQTPLRKHGADVNISEVIHPLPKHTHGWGSRTVAVKSSEVNKQMQLKVSVFY